MAISRPCRICWTVPSARQTPLVGYVDNTYSRDVVTLLATLHGLPPPVHVNDASLLGATLPDWGDRSPFWVCARPDRLSTEGRADFYKRVCFCLARLSVEHAPARLEIPRWLLESGRADEVVELVLAEAVVGGGYPYVLEAADVTAVIQQKDRQRFLSTLPGVPARAKPDPDRHA